MKNNRPLIDKICPLIIKQSSSYNKESSCHFKNTCMNASSWLSVQSSPVFHMLRNHRWNAPRFSLVQWTRLFYNKRTICTIRGVFFFTTRDIFYNKRRHFLQDEFSIRGRFFFNKRTMFYDKGTSFYKKGTICYKTIVLQ